MRERAPQALICLDAFHVVKWAGERLDELRRRLAGELRAAGHEDQAAALGAGMWALRKKPENLTTGQRTALAQIAADNKPLYKGYLIKEQLREAFRVKGHDGKALLAGLDLLGAQDPHPRIRETGENPHPVPGPHLEHPRPRAVQRPRRGTERPAQRPHHPREGLPQRRRPHRDGGFRLRRPLPRFTLLTG